MRFTAENTKRCIFTLIQKSRKVKFDIDKLCDIQERLSSGITEREMYEYAEWIDSRIFHNFVLDEADQVFLERNIDIKGHSYEECGKIVNNIARQTENDVLFGGVCMSAHNYATKIAKKSSIPVLSLNTSGIPGERFYHEAVLAKFKVKSKECNIIFDPTFRQFCTSDKNESIVGEVLRSTAKGKELGSELIHKGFAEFNDDAIKTYGVAFCRAKKSAAKPYQLSSEQYLKMLTSKKPWLGENWTQCGNFNFDSPKDIKYKRQLST